ncbi:MAG: hypothetical protein V1249_13460 [Acidimicrobiales bacterium]|jgi:hypothetical protein|nr:hypothetical protein [Acidimicrobiales bacterium]
MTDTDPADEETMSAPTEAVLEKLQSSPEGRMHLQIAMQAVVIEQLRREIAALTNGHEPEVVEAVVEGAEN